MSPRKQSYEEFLNDLEHEGLDEVPIFEEDDLKSIQFPPLPKNEEKPSGKRKRKT